MADKSVTLMDELLQPFPTAFARGTDIFVAASGKMTTSPPDRMHRHDFYELVWVVNGRCQFFSDFNLYPFETGSLAFISPGQLHDYIIEQGAIELLIFGFRPNLLPNVAHHLVNILPFDDPNRAPILQLPSEAQGAISQLVNIAHQRFDQQPTGWEALITTYLQTVLTEAAYLMPEEWIVQASSAAVQLTRAFQQAIERNYRQRRQVQAYAEMLGVTSNYLVKTVREMTSMTPKQLLQERLLLEAKRLLVHTPYSVNEISELLEFPNSTSFARWFKKEATQTPTEFRQQATNNLRLNRQSS